MGALDFAGGTVVHITSGVSALVCARVLGPRVDAGKAEPHNTVLTLFGAFLLLFGWYGFNAGSALAANGVAANALVTTHLAASAGAVAWVTANWLRTKKVSALAVGLGAVAGLVCVTPAAGFVTPMSAVGLGSIAGIVCSWAVERVKVFADDSLDVFAVHGVGGVIGAVLTGVATTTAVNAAGVDGSMHQVGVQVLAVASVATYSGFMTWGILKVVALLGGLRVPSSIEESGLDVGLHGEQGYRFR